MTWNFTMGIISTVALFLPIAFILILRMGRYRTFPVLIAYFTIAIINNFFGEGYVVVNNDIVKYWSLANNILDAPLMMLFLTYFCTTILQARRMRMLILSFLLFELVVILFRGLTKEAITIILAPGLGIVFSFCLYFFIRHAKKAITHRKATGKALIAAALLFAYGCFSILYLMFYVFQTYLVNNIVNQQYLDDTYLIYFFALVYSQ